MLYQSTKNNPFGSPGNNLGNLTGSDNPSTQGIYTYTATDLTLDPSTFYFIVLTAETATANLGNGFGESGYHPMDGWNTAFNYYSNNEGVSWAGAGGGPEYAIIATPIPEPSAEMLLGLSGIFLLGFRRWNLSWKHDRLWPCQHVIE